MKPWGSFQVNEAMDVVFMILGGCFISEIVLCTYQCKPRGGRVRAGGGDLTKISFFRSNAR